MQVRGKNRTYEIGELGRFAKGCPGKRQALTVAKSGGAYDFVFLNSVDLVVNKIRS